ncbi:MAG TPA: nucleotidyltransferase family protein [Bryobacteraceae bacterium]|nr:nucleotidyltransferase family protein [Bryobacteraceae bacterium]
MKSFETFLVESATYSGGVNLVFEAGMYSLTNDLELIINALREAGIPFEIVGGVAVNAHIFGEHRSRSFVTRDIDILLRRADLEEASKAAEPLGYRARKRTGGYTLMRAGQQLAEAVHLRASARNRNPPSPWPS